MLRALSALALAILCVLLPGRADAQLPIEHGGYGYASPGLAVVDVSFLGVDLAKSFGLDEGFPVSPLGFTLGGGGKALIASRWIVGGKGYLLLFTESTGGDGTVSMLGGGGGFDIGYAAIQERPWLVYPYQGVGGIGLTMDVSNGGARDVKLGDSTIIRSGETGTFDTGSITVELGVGMQRLFFEENGGFIVGGELGVMLTPAEMTWQDGRERDLAGVHPSRLLGVFVRIDLGGGGFLLDDGL
jgi:hypothetical protein